MGGEEVIKMVYADPVITSPLGMLSYLNTVTYNTFWSLIIFVIFIITYISLSNYSFKNAILPSLYAASVSAVLFYSMSLIDSWVVVSLMIISAIATFYVYLVKSDEKG